MSQENVELVRSVDSGWERGDFDSAEWADQEIEFVIAHGLSPGDTTGVPQARDRFKGWLSLWEDYRIEADEYREIDAESVLVLFRFVGRGRGSGIEIARVHSRGALLFTVHDGLVTKLVNYPDAHVALADLGLAD